MPIGITLTGSDPGRPADLRGRHRPGPRQPLGHRAGPDVHPGPQLERDRLLHLHRQRRAAQRPPPRPSPSPSRRSLMPPSSPGRRPPRSPDRTALGATQLNATADVPGTFAYTPAPVTVLHSGPAEVLWLTFTPTDTVSYATATATVTIDVTKAPLTVTADSHAKAYLAPLPTSPGPRAASSTAMTRRS